MQENHNMRAVSGPFAPVLPQAGPTESLGRFLDDPGRPDGDPLRLRPSSFFRRVFLWILGMSLVMSVGSSTVYYTRQMKFLEADNQRRSRSLLGYLAAQAEIGAYADDPGLLDLPARRLAQEEDVVFVALYDKNGKELIHKTESGFPPPAPPPYLVQQVASTGVSPQPMRNDAGNYEDHYAPIVTSERDPQVAAFLQPSDRVKQKDLVVGVARIGLSLRPANDRLKEVLRWGILLGLSLLGLGAAAAYFIAGKISVPILALARGADEIRNGNLTPQIDVRRDDELGTLADSFVRMAARLRETMAELEQLNKNLEAEVQRRTRQIQHAYEFTSVLNAPIDRHGTDPARMDAADTSVMLDLALSALCEATGTRGGGVFLPGDDEPNFTLVVRAAYSVTPAELGPAPSRDQIEPLTPESRDRSSPRVAVELVKDRLMVPLIFRNQPLGALALMLRSEHLPDPSMVEFVRQAAAQLAIALSNARAYARVAQLAYELTERNMTLAAQRDQMKAQRDQLEQQRNQMEQQRDQLEQQRDQLEQQSMQLRAQRNQLQEVNRLKSEFLASISHELRTPLNAIMGYSELVCEGVYGPISDDARDAMSGVLESSSNLLTLINQILDLARVEAGKMTTHLEEVDVIEMVSSVVKEADVMCRDRPYRVRLQCAVRPKIHTDRSKLQQILTNLIANAVKFTQAGHVDVNVAYDFTGDLLFAVRDTGIGIQKDHIDIIFEEFRQVDGSSTRRFGGTGLGLAIARRMAGLLGGTIKVESVYGVGSTFTLRLQAGPGARATAKLRAISTSPLDDEEQGPFPEAKT